MSKKQIIYYILFWNLNIKDRFILKECIKIFHQSLLELLVQE